MLRTYENWRESVKLNDDTQSAHAFSAQQDLFAAWRRMMLGPAANGSEAAVIRGSAA